ncbi:MAG TPA: hypothetical protein ENK43_11040 [Planctomycetes bacterium]|nr:hypothetical protein [Planctomycetota bacterium]
MALERIGRLATLGLWVLLQSCFVGQVKVRTVDGELHEGRLTALSEQGDLVLSGIDGATHRLSARRVLWIRWSEPKASEPGAGSRLLRFDLWGGDRIFGEIQSSDFDSVVLKHSLLGRLELPLDAVHQVMVLSNAARRGDHLGEDAPKDRDVIFMRSGNSIDKLAGDLIRLKKSAAVFEWGSEESTFRFNEDRVVAIRLAEEDVVARPQGLHAQVLLKDGSRFTGRFFRSQAGPFRLQSPLGFDVEIQENALVEVGFRGGDFVFLSDLEPVKVEETPFIQGDLAFGLHRDEGLRGGPPTISDEYFLKALCVHTRCAVTYRLDGRFESFVAAVGLDGLVADKDVPGSAAFSVLGDGRPLSPVTVMKAGEPARWISVTPLGDVRELTLLADFSENFHFNGWAVWGDPVLVLPRPTTR